MILGFCFLSVSGYFVCFRIALYPSVYYCPIYFLFLSVHDYFIDLVLLVQSEEELKELEEEYRTLTEPTDDVSSRMYSLRVHFLVVLFVCFVLHLFFLVFCVLVSTWTVRRLLGVFCLLVLLVCPSHSLFVLSFVLVCLFRLFPCLYCFVACLCLPSVLPSL